MSHPLDNPVWSALTGPQSNFAVSAGRFSRYRPDVALFLAAEHPASGFGGLETALQAGEVVGIVATRPVQIPNGLQTVEVAAVPQMVAADFRSNASEVEHPPLDDTHVRAMLELIALTHPGPFLPRTIELGGYRGIFDGERLVAMAGGRMRAPGFAEVSAVCTHPDYQGRGYGKALVSAVAREIIARGETPFLHVRAENSVAIGAYQKLGFRIRREMVFTVVRRPAG